MAKSKKSEEVIVSFADSSSVEQVTGSRVSVNDNMLIEFGSSQGGSLLDNYKNNSRNFSFSVKKLEYLFLCHMHIDHVGLAPLIKKRGGNPKVFIPSGNSEVLYLALTNSSMILEGEAKTLSARSKNGKEFMPIYTQEDVESFMENVYEVDFGIEKKLDDNTSFKFISSGHIPFASSLILNSKGKSIYYTSDLGNDMFESYYCEPMEVPKSADLVISECTYALAKRSTKDINEREKDLQRIESAVEQYNKILIPSFSLQRAQTMLTVLFVSRVITTS